MRTLTFLIFSCIIPLLNPSNSLPNYNPMERKLQHIVLIEFKAGTQPEDIQAVKTAALKLQEIPGVMALRFSENVSPENLNKNYTHALTMWFKTTSDRDEVYLPHPKHQKFVDFFVPYTANVLVFDYWE